MVSAAGRLFYILDEGPIGVADKRLPQKWALVARDAFSGNKHFSQTNAILEKQGQTVIDWSLD